MHRGGGKVSVNEVAARGKFAFPGFTILSTKEDNRRRLHAD